MYKYFLLFCFFIAIKLQMIGQTHPYNQMYGGNKKSHHQLNQAEYGYSNIKLNDTVSYINFKLNRNKTLKIISYNLNGKMRIKKTTNGTTNDTIYSPFKIVCDGNWLQSADSIFCNINCPDHLLLDLFQNPGNNKKLFLNRNKLNFLASIDTMYISNKCCVITYKH